MSSSYTLVTSDKQEFDVDIKIVNKFKMLDIIISDMEGVDKVPIHNVNGAIFQKVLDYANLEIENKSPDDLHLPWKEDFMNIDEETIFSLILAANYLDYKNLLDLGCMTIAKKMKDKTPEQIRQAFGIEKDLTPEEEQEIIDQFGENAFQ